MADSKYQLRAAQILGPTNEKTLSQARVFIPRDEEKQKKRGSLLLILSLKSSAEKLEPDWGKELLTRFQEEYYGQTEGWPMERLAASLKKIAREVEESNLPFQFEAVAAVLWQNVWYFASWGKGKVLVRRGPTMAAALVGKEGEVVSSSGPAEAGDLVLLGSDDFLAALESEEINKIMNLENEEEIAEAFSTAIAKKETLGSLVALIAQLVPEEEGSKEEEREPSKKKEKVSLARYQGKIKQYGRWGLILVALVLLILSALLWKNKRSVSKKSEYLSQAKEEYQQAAAALDIDPQQAESFLKKAEEWLAKAKEEEKETGEETASLQREIDQLKEKIEDYQTREIVSLPVFFDFADSEEKFSVDMMASLGKSIFILDEEKQKIVRLDWEDKETEVVLGDEKLSRAQAFFPQVSATGVFLGDGLYFVEKGELKKVIEEDEKWQEVVDLAGWLGNFYLLDSGADQIWQYPATTNGLGARKSWLKEEGENFGSQAKMVIDGSIFIADQGHIYRYYKGYKEDDFEIDAAQGEIFLATTADSDNLYLLNKGLARLLVISKEKGEIEKEIPLSEMKEATGLVVSPDETVALVGLKHQLLKIDLTEEEEE